MAAIFKYKLHSLGSVLTTLSTVQQSAQTYTDGKHYLLFPNWSEFLWKIIAADESWDSEGIQWKKSWVPKPEGSTLGVEQDPENAYHFFSIQSCAPIIGSSGWDCQHRVLLYCPEAFGGNIQRKWSELSCMSVCHYVPAQSTLKMQEFFGLTTQYLLTTCPCSPYLPCIHFWRFKSHWRIQRDTQRHKQKVTWQDMATVLEMVQTFAKLEWEIIIIQTR